MRVAGLVAAWPLLAIAVGWHWRPRRTLVLAGPDEAPPPDLIPVNVSQVARSIGARIRRGLGRPPDPGADLVTGLVVLVGALLALVSPPLALVAPLGGVVVPRMRARRRRQRRSDQIADELPEVIDLLLLAAGSGLTCLSSVAVVTQRCDGPVAGALAHARTQIDLGRHPDDAFALIVDDLGEPARPLVDALLGSLREGTPLVPSLERVGDEARRRRRRRAEETARKVPIKLLFPLVLCTLPAFALLTVVPLLVSALGSL